MATKPRMTQLRGTPNRVFYSDSGGDLTELAIPSDAWKFPKSDGSGNLEFKQLGLFTKTGGTATIASGVITVAPQSYGQYTVTCESGTADDLDTISGGSLGDVIVLRAAASNVISITSAGNVDVLTAINITDKQSVILLHNGTDWISLVPIPSNDKNLWIGGWQPTMTTGCGLVSKIEMGTNKNVYDYVPFDAAANEYAYVNVPMPLDYDGGTITAKFYWTHPATTTNFDVRFALQAVAIANDGTLDVAYGTAVSVVDTGGTTNDLYITDATAEITIAGTPVAGEYVSFEVYRGAVTAEDTLAVDAYLLGVLITYGVV